MPEKNKIKTVLILEDEPVICKILTRSLEAGGIKVEIAGNGMVAVEKIDAGMDYDLIICDIRTPLINGIQFYEYLETIYPYLTEKVMFMTGDCLNIHTAAFLERVKRPYITKPFIPDQIIDLINRSFHTDLLPVNQAFTLHPAV